MALSLGSFSGGGLGFGVAFTLKDAFSKTANKIQQSLGGLNNRTAKVSNSINKSLAGVAKGATLIGLGAALLTPLTAGIKRIATLDDLMADVRKTTGLTQVGVKDLKEELQNFDTRTSLEDLLDITRIGGQIGVAKNELIGFTDSIDKAVVALGDEFGGGADVVASELGKLNSIFGVAKAFGVAEGLNKIGSSINSLGAAGLATAPFLTNFTKRLGPVADAADIDITKILGLGAALEQLGARPEEASSGISRLFNVLTTKTSEAAAAAGIDVSTFSKMLKEDANDAILVFAENMKKNFPDQLQFNQALKDIGLTGVNLTKTMAQLSSNTDLVREKQKLANEEFIKGTSIIDEYNLKNSTLPAKLEKLKKVFQDITEALAIGIIPIFNILIFITTALSKAFLFLAKTKVGRAILTLVGIMGGLLVVVGAATLAINGTRLALFGVARAFFAARSRALMYIIANKGVVAGMRIMAAQAWTTAVAMLAAYWPVVLVVGLIAAAVFSVVQTYKAATAAFSNFLETGEKGKGFILIFQKIGAVIQAVREMFTNEDNGKTFLSKETFQGLQKLGLVNFVIKLSTWISRLKAFWEGLMEGFSMMFNIVGPAVVEIFDSIGDIFASLGFDIERLGGSLFFFKTLGKAAFVPIIVVFKALAFAFRSVGFAVQMMVTGFRKLVELKDNVKDFLGSSFSDKLKTVGSLFGFSEDEEDQSDNIRLPVDTGPNSEQAAEVLANGTVGPALASRSGTPNVNVSNTQAPINVTVEVDSEKVADKVIEKQEFANSITYE